MLASDEWQDDALSNGPVVLIIDTVPLRSLDLISMLNHLDRLAVPSKAAPDEKEHRIEADCEMLIYNAGSAADRDNLERVQALRVLVPDVPLMIICDNKSREKIISSLTFCGQGFLYIGTNAERALQAFSFMVNGRSYSALATRPKQTYPAQRHPATDCIPTPSFVMGGDNGAAKDLERPTSERSSSNSEADGGPRTPEPWRLLEKVIARRLGMREGTVKVHVRQIMRKFGDEPDAGRCCLRARR